MAFPATFRAYEYAAFGEPLEVVRLNAQTPQPPLRATQVRIQVHAAAINPIDLKLIRAVRRLPVALDPRAALEPSDAQPFAIGFDVAGTLVEVGDAVTDFKAGDAVYAMVGHGFCGSFAEYHVLDAAFVAPMPTSLTFNEAAAVPLVAQTSWQSLVDAGKLKQGDRVLILGGAAATGAVAIQIAKALGAFVIATASPRNCELVKSLGADLVIDYTTEKWADVVEPHSIDVFYDCGVEPNAWNGEGQRVLKKETGQFVTILTTTDPIASPIGATHHKVMCRPTAANLKQITDLIDAGRLKVPIDSVHSFEDMTEVIKIQQSGKARGKVILQILP